MSKETRAVLGIIIAVVFLGLKIAARSSRSNRYSSSSPSTLDFDKLQREQLAREMAKEEAEARAAEAEDKKLRESVYDEHCQADQSSELMLEVQCDNRDFLEVNALILADYLPPAAKWPRPLKVAGVEVAVVHRGPAADDHPNCLDVDAALIKRVREGLKLADAKGTRIEGALVVKTTDSTAAQLMLASDVKATVGGHGPVVAFVGSDNLAVFADASNLASVRAAARASAEGIDPSGNQGCSLIEPMVLTDGVWSAWKAPASLNEEVQAHRRVVKACLGMLLQDSLAALPGMSPNYPIPNGLETVAARRFDTARGAIAKVSLDRMKGPQLVVLADEIELSHNDGRLTRLTWGVFQRAAKKALTPVTLGTRRYSDAWMFDPEMVASLDTASNETLAALK